MVRHSRLFHIQFRMWVNGCTSGDSASGPQVFNIGLSAERVMAIRRLRKLFIGTRLMFLSRRLGYDRVLRPVLLTKQSPLVLVTGDRGAYGMVVSEAVVGGCIHRLKRSLVFEK